MHKHIALKVEHSSWKLQGRHPSEILLRELEAKHGKKPCWAAMQRLVRGEIGLEGSALPRCRSELLPDAAPGRGHLLSPLEQVQCLLELATDPLVLGRTWQGWRPWL